MPSWVCTNCDKTGPGKPKAKCPDCGKATLKEVKEKPAFGKWWDSLSGTRKQELLRAHGTHEAAGGAQMKQKGGGDGGKGDQHDDGVAQAKAKIKKKYDAGDYD